MKREELKYAKNAWIGEFLVANRNFWESGNVVDAVGFVQAMVYLMWSIMVFLGLGGVAIFAPIHVISHWENLLIDCHTYTPTTIIPKICASVPLYNVSWYPILSCVLTATALLETISIIMWVSVGLNTTIGFYSKPLYEKRIEKERIERLKEIKRVKYEHKMFAKKRRSRK